MNPTQVVLFSILALSVWCLPSTLDIRYQPQAYRFGSFEPSSDTICSCYDWAKQLAQVVGNRVSIDKDQSITLSAQQIA
jgi:hypothetical protein